MSNKNQVREDVSIRYDKAEIAYISQFLVSPGPEEVLLEMSSGVIANPDKTQTLPIQNRVALPWSAVERLSNVLNKIVDQRKQQVQSSQRPERKSTSTTVPKAKLPQMSARNVSAPAAKS